MRAKVDARAVLLKKSTDFCRMSASNHKFAAFECFAVGYLVNRYFFLT